ncbi:uncharacterized protein BP5553_01576 [Venustampulla echinocandica]|uniref:5'-3' DNA helicase ZGRF1-like N-terminal domain-containing protein n=1 Tax=Venustampulla echinocandica TaxID=2656787 RepID=A0A370U1E5_9HELO|nr:uncharacterized protein BP5553_01576 [Venustampulla echinocandica]RDL41597.1 hypothetical protein BP5553_01576 [Venustampulla echinocandica]
MALLANTPTTTASRITAPLDVPQTQNTAPVLEFRCLYTQDLRRKQKRWQDGRLKFHTFNKRVMIYDEQSNFVGDTHWRDDDEFTEGEELQLDRRGILVEVGECLGKRDQDLTELLSKRAQEKEGRAAARIANPSPTTSVGRFQNVRAAVTTLTPKPLSALLTPSRHYGRAMVSNASPFEERQRLENGNHNEEANRPAKRRKPDDVTQSKSGYAQNLMGATLNLASSRPPSTATVRYDLPEPNITRPSEVAIDLTLDDDDGGNVINPKSSNVDQAITAAKQAVVKRANSRRTPPPKSGYASNLTGAALTLTGPSAMSARPSFKALAMEKTSRKRHYETESSSAAEDDGILIDINPSLDRPATITKPRGSATVCTKPLVQKSTSNVDNCQQVVHPQPSLNSTRSFLETATIRDIGESTSDQPMSSLRIRARPPRKMMMLMDRPNSRPRKESSGKIGLASKNVTKSFQSTNEPILSQDTRHLNSFYQNQEEKLQAFLKGKRNSINLDLEEDEEDSSPTLDKVTDRRTIDPPLSRKGRDTEVMTLHSSDRPPGPMLSGSPRATAPPELLARQPHKAKGDIALNNCTVNLPRKDGWLLSGVESEDNPASNGNRAAEPARLKNVEGKLGVAAAPPISWKPKTDRMDGTNRSSISSLRNASTALVAGTQTAYGSDQQDTHRDLAARGNSTNPMSEEKLKGSPDQGPSHVSKAVQYTSERFRAMIKPSTTAADPGVGTRSPAVVSPVGLTDQSVLDYSSSSQELEQASSGQVVKAPPELAVKQWIPADSKPSNDSGFRPANLINTTSGLRHNPVLAPNNTGPSQIKAKLVNPATRGKSVQAAATITDAVDQASTVSAPPVEHISSRPAPGSILARNMAQNEGLLVDSAPVTGPWSREAFDLFGSWLPPGRERPGEDPT